MIPLLRNRNSYLFGLSNPQILDSRRLETSSGLRANQALSPAGYEPNHDELRCERKRTVSTPQGEVRTSATARGPADFKASLHVDQTGVIDATRQRQHRQDHDGGYRYCRESRRQAIGKLGPVELVRRQQHLTGIVQTERTVLHSSVRSNRPDCI